MTKRIGLIGLFAGVAAVGLAYASAFLPGGMPAWAPWSFVLGMSTAITAVFVIGACRNGRLGGLAFVFAFVFTVIMGGFGLLLTMPLEVLDPTRLWLGLPPGAAILLYGIGLLPLFVVPVAYALTFDRLTLSSADIERVRRMGEERAALLAAERFEAARAAGAGAAAATMAGRSASRGSGVLAGSATRTSGGEDPGSPEGAGLKSHSNEEPRP